MLANIFNVSLKVKPSHFEVCKVWQKEKIFVTKKEREGRISFQKKISEGERLFGT